MKKIGCLLLCSILFFLSLVIEVKAEESIYINFYDENGKLLSGQVLFKEEKIAIPTVLKEGHNFIGFNTQPDGSGEYLQSNVAIQSKDYYAIYTPIMYPVHYYVDNQWVHTELVAYGKEAPNITVEDKEGFVFSGWQGTVNITEERYLYGVYEVKEEEEIEIEKEITLHLITKDEKTREIEKSPEYDDNSTDLQLEKKSEGKKEQNNNRFIVGGVVFLGSSFLFYMIFKKVNFNKRK